jgi:hypothetical protein
VLKLNVMRHGKFVTGLRDGEYSCMLRQGMCEICAGMEMTWNGREIRHNFLGFRHMDYGLSPGCASIAVVIQCL